MGAGDDGRLGRLCPAPLPHQRVSLLSILKRVPRRMRLSPLNAENRRTERETPTSPFQNRVVGEVDTEKQGVF